MKVMKRKNQRNNRDRKGFVKALAETESRDSLAVQVY